MAYTKSTPSGSSFWSKLGGGIWQGVKNAVPGLNMAINYGKGLLRPEEANSANWQTLAGQATNRGLYGFAQAVQPAFNTLVTGETGQKTTLPNLNYLGQASTVVNPSKLTTDQKDSLAGANIPAPNKPMPAGGSGNGPVNTTGATKLGAMNPAPPAGPGAIGAPVGTGFKNNLISTDPSVPWGNTPVAPPYAQAYSENPIFRQYDSPYQAPPQASYGDITNQINNLREQYSVTPQDVESTENARKQAVAEVINRSYDVMTRKQDEANKTKEYMARALGINTSGGTGNVTSTQGDQLSQVLDRNQQLIQDLEGKRQDAISTNDTEAAKRIEDRQTQIATINQQMTKDAQDRYGLVESVNAQQRQDATARGQLDVASRAADVNEYAARQDVRAQDKTAALTAIKDQLDAYGSNAFRNMDPSAIAQLEATAGLPQGSLQRGYQTTNQPAANMPYEYISGTEWNNSGRFNKATGEWEQIGPGNRAGGSGGTGIPQEQYNQYKQAYMALPMQARQDYLDKLSGAGKAGDSIAAALLGDPEVTGILNTAQDTSATQLGGFAQGVIQANPNATRQQVEDALKSEGVDPQVPGVKAALDSRYSLWNRFTGMFK